MSNAIETISMNDMAKVCGGLTPYEQAQQTAREELGKANSAEWSGMKSGSYNGAAATFNGGGTVGAVIGDAVGRVIATPFAAGAAVINGLYQGGKARSGVLYSK
jgi:hypothetical protein